MTRLDLRKGLLRFWLVVGAVWIGLTSYFADWREPTQVSVQQWNREQPSFEEIKQVHQRLCDRNSQIATMWGVEQTEELGAIGIIAPPNPQGVEFTPELYCLEKGARQRQLRENIEIIFLPPFVLFLLGYLLLWIGAGFRRGK